MFALPNLNILLSNIPQMPTRAKYGMFQSSSFTSIKKFPEVDVVCSELSQTLQLIRDLKCERRLMDILAGAKFELTLRAAEWPVVEDIVHKLTKWRRRESVSLNTRCKEAVHSVAPFNESNNVIDTISNEKQGDNSFETLSPCSNTNSYDQTTSNPANASEEYKKSSSIMSQFVSFKNVSNQSIFKNGSLHVNPGGGIHINSNENGPFHGQKRGFKTNRQPKIELELSALQKLTRSLLDKNSGSKQSEPAKSGKDDGTDSKSGAFHSSNMFIKSLADVIRLVFYGGGIFLFYELYRTANSKKFSSNHISEKVNVTFEDAKGMEEAKAELKCVVEFLRDPSKFMYLGGKLPSGILLQGPPGTGKTLLARAVAGEANVEFFHISGSEFDEILVGEGARRVRSLFRAARSKAPAVIFIDEIDAVGGKRVSNTMHPFANQTIIQLLAEMDGFVENDKIVVIGATNRASDLDEALLRPGRFDLKIQLHAPDIKGRREILKLHLSKIISKDVDIDYIAKRTVGFSGADLENVVNQAALLAATVGCEYVATEHMDKALEKIMLGPALKSRVRTEQMNKVTAYHESGHATVAYFTPNSNPPVKASIIPHGNSLGHTAILPEEKYTRSKSELLALIDVKLGGRAAEELIFGPDKVTTGCQDDLNGATALASEMVCNWGMSDKVGLRTHRRGKSQIFDENEIGPAAGDEIDEEIKRIIQESYERAKKILKKHSKEHRLLAEKLLDKETLEAEEIREILGQGKDDEATKE